jgi:hypothetical protein
MLVEEVRMNYRRSRPILFLEGIYAVMLIVILEIFFLFRSWKPW